MTKEQLREYLQQMEQDYIALVTVRWENERIEKTMIMIAGWINTQIAMMREILTLEE